MFVQNVLYKEKIMTSQEVGSRIIVALDVKTLEEAALLVEQLQPFGVAFKIGLELISSVGGPQAVQFVHELGGRVFYDGKFKDIPNTVGAAAKAVAGLGVAMFNVHASSGIDAMFAAVDNKVNAKVLAVTVLTSFEENDGHLTYGAPTKATVLQFARNAKLAGIDGIICSPQELPLLSSRRELRGMMFVTPGVRPSWAAANDQKRIMTPGEAVLAGATHFVIGRPITQPPESVGSPVRAVEMIISEMTEALKQQEVS